MQRLLPKGFMVSFIASSAALALAAGGAPALAQGGDEDEDPQVGKPSDADQAPQTTDRAITLGPVQVEGAAGVARITPPTGTIGNTPDEYAGGQLARGARIGVLGNTDFMETPFNTLSFTDAFRDNLQARTAADILQYAVSVTSAQPGASAQNDGLFIRGFEHFTNTASFDGLAGLFSRQPPVEPFERFEVLLGPSAFANGRPAEVGGTVNLVPKRATDTPLTRVSLIFESDSIFGASFDVGRRFGENNEWGVRVNGVYADGTTAVEHTNRQREVLSLALDYRGERFRASLDLMRANRDQRDRDRLTIAAGVPLPNVPEASELYNLRGTRNEQELDLAVGRVEWDFIEDWTVSVAYGRSNIKRDRQLFSEPRLVDGAGTLTYSAGDFTRAIDGHSAEALARGRFTTGNITHRLSFGGTRYQLIRFFTSGPRITPAPGTLSLPNTSPLPPVPVAVLPPNRSDEQIFSGLFVSDEIGLFDDRLLITLGARQAWLETSSFNRQTGQRSGGYKDSATTPAFGLVFKLSPKLSFYANHVEALENGVIVNTNPPAVNQGELLPPLESEQAEVGIKADLGKLAITAALFQIERGLQFLDTASNTFVQDGRQRNRGLELSVFGEPLSGLRVYSGLSILDAEIRRSRDGLLDGNVPATIPGFTLTSTVDWDVPALTGLALLGSFVHNGDAWLDQQNTREVPGWTRFDLGLRYRARISDQAIIFRLNVENVADRNYFVAGGNNIVYVAPPRTFLLSATIDL